MHRTLSYRSLLVATAIALAPLALNAQATSAVTCKDGTTSTATGRGACSGHGGVDRSPKSTKATKSSTKAAKAETKAAAKAETKAAAKADKAETKAETKADQQQAKETKAVEKAARKSASSDVRQTSKVANATAANTDPTNATAKCKDGTYSHAATHRGACSRHGGVAEWLKS